MSVKIKRFNLCFKHFDPKEYCSTGEFLSFDDHAAKMAELQEEYAAYRYHAETSMAEKVSEIHNLQRKLGKFADSEIFWYNHQQEYCKRNDRLTFGKNYWKKKTITVFWVAFFYAAWAVIHCLRYAFGM